MGEETIREKMTREAREANELMEERYRRSIGEMEEMKVRHSVICPNCGREVPVSEAEVLDLKIGYTIERSLEAGRQLRAKKGPYYSKWLIGMRRSLEKLEEEAE